MLVLLQSARALIMRVVKLEEPLRALLKKKKAGAHDGGEHPRAVQCTGHWWWVG
jgi:hypothetical protein